jgi:hypothetical protein
MEMMDEPVVVDARQRYLHEFWAAERRKTHMEMGPSVTRRNISVGMIALGLEIETRARLSERLGDVAFEMSDAKHVASTLRDLLRTVGIADQVRDEYDRQVRSLIADDAVPASSQPRSGASSLAGAAQLAALASAAFAQPHDARSEPDTGAWPGEDNANELVERALGLESAIGSEAEPADEGDIRHAGSTPDPDWYDGGARS